MNRINDIILSILETKNIAFIRDRLDYIGNNFNLSSVSKQIITVINESIAVNKLVSTSYIKNQFNYVYSEEKLGISTENIYDMDSIDDAITQELIKSRKNELANDLTTLSSELPELSIDEIKAKLDTIKDDELVSIKKEAPENGFKKLDNPYEALMQNKGEFTLLLDDVEKHAGQAARGTITTILGFVASGKSTYAMNVAVANALMGHNVLYLALENTETQIFSNAVLSFTADMAKQQNDLIDGLRLRDNKLSPEEIEIFNARYNELATKLEKNLIIWDAAKFEYNTMHDMTKTLRLADNRFKEKTGKGLDCLFIDQVSLLRQTKGSGRKATYDGAVINDWMVYFNEQALNFLNDDRKIAVFAVSQVGREKHAEASKKKNKGRYGADCASDSNEIERISTTMITLFMDNETQNTLLVGIPKARRGKTTDNPIQVEFYGEYAHVGSLNIGANTITADDFNEEEFDISDLI